MPRLSYFRAAAVLPLMVGIASCDAGPTTPSGPPRVLAPAAQVQAFLPSVTDAVHRVAPGLSDAAVRGQIGAQLTALEQALQQRDVTRVQNAATSARNLLAHYNVALRAQDGPDLTVIELVLDGIDDLLTEPTP